MKTQQLFSSSIKKYNIVNLVHEEGNSHYLNASDTKYTLILLTPRTRLLTLKEYFCLHC